MKEIPTYFLDGGQTHYVAPNLLKAAPDNPRVPLRLSDPGRYEELKQSLLLGAFETIKVEEGTLEIVSGHQRVEVARDIGIKELPVQFYRKLTPEEKIRIRIASNAHAGAFDIKKLATQMDALPEDDRPLAGLDQATLDLITPMDTFAANPEEEPTKFETLKFRLPAEAAARITDVLNTVAKKQKAKVPTALAYVIEVYAQDPDNGID